jgi:hypothetical protein
MCRFRFYKPPTPQISAGSPNVGRVQFVGSLFLIWSSITLAGAPASLHVVWVIRETNHTGPEHDLFFHQQQKACFLRQSMFSYFTHALFSPLPDQNSVNYTSPHFVPVSLVFWTKTHCMQPTHLNIIIYLFRELPYNLSYFFPYSLQRDRTWYGDIKNDLLSSACLPYKVNVTLLQTVSRRVYVRVRHPSGAHDKICITVRQLRVCWLGAPSLTIVPVV